MGRFSPTVIADKSPDFESNLARMIGFMRQSKLDKERAEERDWEREWSEEARRYQREQDEMEQRRLREQTERRRELEDLELYESGYRRFDESPKREIPPEAPDLFQGGRGMGMQPTQPPGEEPPLAGMLRPGGRTTPGDGQQPLALPGQFVPGGGFVPTAVYSGGSPLPEDVEAIKTPDFNPAAYGEERPHPSFREFLTAEGTEVPDPRYEQVTGSIYRDLERDPRAAEAARREENATALSQILGAMRGEGPETDALAQLLARGDVDVPASVLSGYLEPEEEEVSEEGVTAEELAAAGVPRFLIPVAQKDEVLARGLIRDALEPDEEDEDVIRVRGREFPDTHHGRAEALTWARQLAEAGRTSPSGGGGDPAFGERRKALVELLGPPTTPERQTVLQQLADGMTPEQVVAEMERYGAPDDVIEEMKSYMRGEERYIGTPFDIRE